MGLDIYVNCDCFECGRLRSPPPLGCAPAVADDGSVLCGSDELDVQLAFDGWRFTEMCEHEDGILEYRRVGNISRVSALRAELSRWPMQFPIILSKVIYNGTHAGDFIPTDELLPLAAEVEALAACHGSNPDVGQLVREFEATMRMMVTLAVQIGKPLVF